MGVIMRIGIIGATGKSGSKLTTEALQRKYKVTGIVRYTGRIKDSRLDVIENDLFEISRYIVKGFDVVINAFRPPTGKEEQHITAMEHLIAVFEDLPDTRFMVVGNAGCLYIDPKHKIQLYATPDFPEDRLAMASAMSKSLELLVASQVNWTYMSPAVIFDPEGARTGRYTLGTDQVFTNAKGESYISYADYAVAMIDEIKNQSFVRKHFTAVSERG
jgi:hypothetical protein